MRFKIVLLILLSAPLSGFCQQSSRKVAEYLVTFAKTAGAIQYFSPSDAVNQRLWAPIYVNGVQMIQTVKDEQALADSLVKIFKPLEPSLLLINDKDTLSRPQPSGKGGQLVITKQNLGLDLYTNNFRAFKSIRLNRRAPTSDVDMVDEPFLAKFIKVPGDKHPSIVKYSYRYRIDAPLKIEISKTGNRLFTSTLLPQDSVFSFTDTLQYAAFNVFQGILVDAGRKINFLLSSATIDKKKYAFWNLPGAVDSVPSTEYQIKLFGNDLPLYKEKYQIGDTLHVSLSKHLKMAFPLAVYGDEENTFPIADAIGGTYKYGKSKFVKFLRREDLDEPTVRIANILQIWNVFRLAYAYDPFSPKEEDAFLIRTLERAFKDKGVDDYYHTVWAMLSAYKDSHIAFSIGGYSDRFSHSAPLTLLPIGGRVYVKLIHDPSLEKNLNIGDELISIDGKPTQDAIKEQLALTSGALPNRMVHVGFNLLLGAKDSPVTLMVKDVRTGQRKTVETVRNYQEKNRYYGTSLTEHRQNGFLDSNVYYFDMTRNNFTDSVKGVMNDPDMHMIIDLRGYPSSSDTYSSVISNMISDTIITRNMFNCKILSVDRKEWVGGENRFEPSSGQQKAKLDFLADASTQSAAETILDIVKYFDVGKIIGQPTSGANGNINELVLPGGMAVTFSGLLVKNSDGTEHHLKGIPPDFYVSYKEGDLISNRDPYMDKAMEVIRKINNVHQ